MNDVFFDVTLALRTPLELKSSSAVPRAFTWLVNVDSAEMRTLTAFMRSSICVIGVFCSETNESMIDAVSNIG